MLRFLVIFISLIASAAASAATSVKQVQQLLEQQNYVDAANAGEQLLLQSPEHARTRFLTAYAYQMSAQTDKAVMLYQDLIKDNPDLPEPRNNLAMIYLAQGDYDRASQLLVEALNTSPSYAIAYDNLSQIYKGIASEAYRRAVSESGEPAKYTHKIELTALTNLEADFAAYTGFYAPEYRARFESHDQWIEYRRKRIARPGAIKVEVSDIQIKWRSENRAIIDFKQAYDSTRYSDRVVKRLGFSRVGSQWKITEEQVLSVL
jgi:tetratricopeptide (TPR) repeat protein